MREREQELQEFKSEIQKDLGIHPFLIREFTRKG